MKTEDMQALAAEAAKNIRSEQDLNEFKKLLTKMTLETALNAELDDHLGYDKHECMGSFCFGDTTLFR
jgi:putative transposase